jgi:valyl-tRNA synthetase
MARVKPLHVVDYIEQAPNQRVATAVLSGAQVVVPLAGLFDFAAERANLEKQRGQTREEVERVRAQLRNEAFTSRAPAAVVDEVRERLEAAEARLLGIEQRLGELE